MHTLRYRGAWLIVSTPFRLANHFFDVIFITRVHKWAIGRCAGMQKPLKKAGKSVKQKRLAVNKHGKGKEVDKKGERSDDDARSVSLPHQLVSLSDCVAAGRLNKAPQAAAAKKSHLESAVLTKGINAKNEKRFAGIAANVGGNLAVVKPPVNATADDKQRQGVGVAWGASSKR